jgi:hypothetical protein
MTHLATTVDGRTTEQADTAIEQPMLVHAGRSNGPDPEDDALQILHDEAGHDGVFADWCQHPACYTLYAALADLNILRAEQDG